MDKMGVRLEGENDSLHNAVVFVLLQQSTEAHSPQANSAKADSAEADSTEADSTTLTAEKQSQYVRHISD